MDDIKIITKAEVDKAAKSLKFKKSLKIGLISMFAVGSLSPLIFNIYTDKNTKQFLLSLGFVAGILGGIPVNYEKEEKLLSTYKKLEDYQLKEQLKGEILVSDTKLEADNRLKLINFVERLPYNIQPLFARKLNVESQLSSNWVESSSNDDEVPTSTPIMVNKANYESVKYKPTLPEMIWIEELVKSSCEALDKRSNQHFKVDGGSQSGKSTLVSTIIAMMTSFSKEPIKINLIDPKYPMTQWILEPSFTGFESVLCGVEAAIQELDTRKLSAKKAKENDFSMPVFDRYLLIIDEWDSIWGNGKGYSNIIDKNDAVKIKNHLMRFLKESAAYNMSAIIIGQSPLTTDNGFTQSTFSSTTRIILGNEALKFVQSPSFQFRNSADNLRNELEDCLGDGKRVALVIPNSGSIPFVEPIPKIDLKAMFG